MKYLIFALLTAVCLGTNARNPTNVHAVPKPAPSAQGTLYLESSIVGGLHLTWLFLGNDGTFVIDPKNGADPVNYALERQNNAGNVGKYTKSGNTITAHYDRGTTEQWKMEYLNGKLNTINGLFVQTVKAMPAGYKITGDFSSSTLLPSVAQIRTYTFSNDGTFKLRTLGAINTQQAAATAQKADGGTYAVKGNTLQLNFNNGQKAVDVIGVYGAGSSTFLVINSSFFEQHH